MKKLVAVLMFVSGFASASCIGPFCWDDTGVSINNGNSLALTQRTLAQINVSAPARAGQLLMCSDCTRSAVCVSTGTGAGAYTILVATGVFAGSTWSGMQHCQ